LESWSTHINPEDHDRIVKSVQDHAKASIAEARQEGLSTLRPIAEAGEVPAGAVRYYFYFSQGEWLTDYCESCDVTHFANILLPPEAKATAVESAKHAYVGYMTDKMPTKPAQKTFEAHGKTWNVHVPGDPMPCDGNALVFITSDNPDVLSHAMPARAWHWGTKTEAKITGWRYADEPTPVEPVKPRTPAVGDVVTLKSGGPKMVVISIREKDDARFCGWFDMRDHAKTAYFDLITLQPT